MWDYHLLAVIDVQMFRQVASWIGDRPTDHEVREKIIKLGEKRDLRYLLVKVEHRYLGGA